MANNNANHIVNIERGLNENKITEEMIEEEDDEEGESTAMKGLKVLARYLFSHVGLCLLVCGYCVGGAFMFQAIEYDGDMQKREQDKNMSLDIDVSREKLANDLWKYKWADNYEEAVDEWLDEYHNNISSAIANHKYQGLPMGQIVAGWAFPSALLFTVTIVTTIGYGNITPVTETGQLLVIAYSLIGIPLMLMFLANIGDAMANFFRVAYGKGCCYICWRRRKRNYELTRQRITEAHRRKPRKAWDTGEDGPRHRRRGSVDSQGKPRRPGSGTSKRSRSNSPPGRPKTGRSTADPNKIHVADADRGGRRRRASEEELDEILRQYRPEDIEEPEEDVINVPISLTLVVIAAYIFIGAVLFAAWNGWTWITGAYFSFVTLATIGFGDLVPGWDEVGSTTGNIKLAASSFYIVLGLAVISMSFNLMMEEMIAKFKWLGRKLGIIDDHTGMRPIEQQPLVLNEAPMDQRIENMTHNGERPMSTIKSNQYHDDMKNHHENQYNDNLNHENNHENQYNDHDNHGNQYNDHENHGNQYNDNQNQHHDYDAKRDLDGRQTRQSLMGNDERYRY